jgi:hypothetical protein
MYAILSSEFAQKKLNLSMAPLVRISKAKPIATDKYQVKRI